MGELTRAELFRYRAEVGRQWARAEQWYQSLTAEEASSIFATFGTDKPAPDVLRSLTETQAQCVVLGFVLVLAELALRSEDAAEPPIGIN